MPPLVVDSREKKPYKFAGINDVVRKDISVGDYTHKGYEGVYAVERKSLDDLARSLGTDRDRFRAEIERATSLSEFAVVIEADQGTLHRYANRIYNPNGTDDLQQNDGPYFSAMHPNAILGTLRDWSNKYNPLEVKWEGNRQDAKQETLRLLDRWYLLHGTSR